jgi:hypothetical protein
MVDGSRPGDLTKGMALLIAFGRNGDNNPLDEAVKQAVQDAITAVEMESPELRERKRDLLELAAASDPDHPRPFDPSAVERAWRLVLGELDRDDQRLAGLELRSLKCVLRFDAREGVKAEQAGLSLHDLEPVTDLLDGLADGVSEDRASESERARTRTDLVMVTLFDASGLADVLAQAAKEALGSVEADLAGAHTLKTHERYAQLLEFVESLDTRVQPAHGGDHIDAWRLTLAFLPQH